MNRKIYTFCVFHPPFIGKRVRAVAELESIPFKDETDGSVKCVNCRDSPYSDSILLVDDEEMHAVRDESVILQVMREDLGVLG